ncbi:MAG: hypothetical protein JO100_01215 [Pseudonocardia sp.]|nr:hypothetical protein [Pseudonocardia sp.]
MLRWLLVTVLLGVIGMLAGTGTAWAHAGGLTSSSNEPAVLGLQPPVPGLDVRVVEFGARIRLTNHTGARVAVVPPPGTVINLLPVVAPGMAGLWSDPRIAEAAARPRPPDDRLAWRIPLLVGDAPVTVLGEQRWPPPPPAGLWWLLTALAVAAPAVLVALGSRDQSEEQRAGWSLGARIVLAAATLILISAHVIHILGSALVPAEGALVWVFLSAAGFAVLGWPIGLVGVYTTLRGQPAGPLLCLVTGTLIAVIISPADIFSFHDAVVPFAWGADFDRALIVLNVGGGLGVVCAATILMRRAPVPVAAEEPCV